jgi:galactitol-specific phosphotransferase system IIB component
MSGIGTSAMTASTLQELARKAQIGMAAAARLAMKLNASSGALKAQLYE